MENIEKPVCGTFIRLERYKNELLKHIEKCVSAEEIKLTVGWYLLVGTSSGLKKDLLLKTIVDNKELLEIAESLTEEEVQNGRKPPLFRKGDVVEVIVNAKNITYHMGLISEIIYHFKEKEWMYYITENNKKVSKRYGSQDLRLIKKAGI